MRNESNLIPKPAFDRAMVERMRSKLSASAGSQDAVKPRLPSALRHNRRAWMGMLAVVGLLIIGNLGLFFYKNPLLEKLGFKNIQTPAGPGAALSRDERALYWAYAAYDAGEFRIRYGLEIAAAGGRANALQHLSRISPGTLAANTRTRIAALKAKRESVALR